MTEEEFGRFLEETFNLMIFHSNQPGWAIRPMADRLGFEYFYGFIAGDTSQWTPLLYRNTTRITPYTGHPGWNLTPPWPMRPSAG